MATSVRKDEFLSLQELSRHLAKHGPLQRSRSALTKYIREGVPTPRGRVRLRAIFIHNARYTTIEWFEEFLRSLEISSDDDA